MTKILFVFIYVIVRFIHKFSSLKTGWLNAVCYQSVNGILIFKILFLISINYVCNYTVHDGIKRLKHIRKHSLITCGDFSTSPFPLMRCCEILLDPLPLLYYHMSFQNAYV